MSESMVEDEDIIQIKEMTIDQLAGAVVLFLGAVGSLLLVIWQSRCACRCRIGCSDKCYIFDCTRDPPPLNEDNEDNDNANEVVNNDNNNDNNDENIIPNNNP
tara:strand:- start:2323 stop:2631 length:309 start_codon:yes stop_codon:yes gene_type:complete